MDKQKEELAWLIFQEADCPLSGEDCSIIADLLINKGYQKHSTADVAEVKRGEWIEKLFGFYNVCSECGATVERTTIKNNSGKLNFCPNCGADMRERKV